ncbi:hypothetical protein BpHYR1_025953 [Brachionus plicatilis]|uniref:Uncharacterized protein n=1 Tax=Brachionus plicatilis TaxID=10195 RepID=A0A3M7SM04_BRAPC|nr:hypothetical protein BpHYR1_025953 [Brachionus plicatilis]
MYKNFEIKIYKFENLKTKNERYEWESSVSSCPDWDKNLICKHISILRQIKSEEDENKLQICTKESQALQKLCNKLQSLIKDFLMVCILQKTADQKEFRLNKKKCDKLPDLNLCFYVVSKILYLIFILNQRLSIRLY